MLTTGALALFDKLGIRTMRIETDPFGNFLGQGYEVGSGRDWARLGNLYLQDGVWNGERILSGLREIRQHTGAGLGGRQASNLRWRRPRRPVRFRAQCRLERVHLSRKLRIVRWAGQIAPLGCTIVLSDALSRRGQCQSSSAGHVKKPNLPCRCPVEHMDRLGGRLQQNLTVLFREIGFGFRR